MMRKKHCHALLVILSSSVALAFAGTQWKPASIVGSIDRTSIPEASGLAASSTVKNRLYHINDAGSAPSFVITDQNGDSPRTIALNLSSWTDTEEVAVGECPDKGSCLYVADIGDNKFKRKNISLHVIPDQELMAREMKPSKSVNLVYEDDLPHNAESFAIHPSRFAYILTKEVPAQLYRISLDEFNEQQKNTRELVLKKIGTLDLTPWLDGTDTPKKIVPTSMAIRPDGKQIVVITRSAGISIDIDLTEINDPEPVDINRLIEEQNIAVEKLPMIVLPQSEGVTYVNEGKSILYSSEIAETGGQSAPLVQIDSIVD